MPLASQTGWNGAMLGLNQNQRYCCAKQKFAELEATMPWSPDRSGATSAPTDSVATIGNGRRIILPDFQAYSATLNTITMNIVPTSDR